MKSARLIVFTLAAVLTAASFAGAPAMAQQKEAIALNDTIAELIQDGSLFPNQVGMEQRRSISLNGDDLTVDNPTPASGGKSQSVWKRIK